MSSNERLLITLPDGTKVHIGNSSELTTTSEPSENLPKLYLNPEKGTKLEMTRIFYVISEMNIILDESGRKAKKKDIFQFLSMMLHADFSNYSKDLSNSLADGSSINKHLKVFEEMRDKMESIFNLR